MNKQTFYVTNKGSIKATDNVLYLPGQVYPYNLLKPDVLEYYVRKGTLCDDEERAKLIKGEDDVTPLPSNAAGTDEETKPLARSRRGNDQEVRAAMRERRQEARDEKPTELASSIRSIPEPTLAEREAADKEADEAEARELKERDARDAAHRDDSHGGPDRSDDEPADEAEARQPRTIEHQPFAEADLLTVDEARES